MFLRSLVLAPAFLAGAFFCGIGGGAAAQPAAFAALPGWTDGRIAEALPSFIAGCARPAAPWRRACADARGVAPGDEAAARAFLERNFQPVRLGPVLVTGYYELEVAGSRTPGGPYQVPVLRPPAEPGRFERSAIEQGALAGRHLEIAWLTNAADLYFLQLQGSGRIRLPDGSVMRVAIAAANGRPSIPTSRLFGDAGIPGNDLSIGGIRSWIAAHPRDGVARLSRDPSFAFFREMPGLSPEQGHPGAAGVPLTPLHSVATDPAALPLGTPLWIAGVGRVPRLAIAQDTGEPIRGAAHIDLFCGWGPGAERTGGSLFARGDVWVLVPRGA
jgi:membrane-bound lytic murein transglycosylase A